MTNPVDLGPFVQRRELKAQEQRVARSAYAYGVDLRRTHFLELSTVGEPLMRVVDRRWNRLAAQLDDHVLARAETDAPDQLLQDVARLVKMLRAPLPTIRLVRPEHAKEWPLATPLGTTKGAIHWLVLDAAGLMALSGTERAFHLAAALAHLQCDHGPYFAATLASHRAGRGLTMVRAALSPWSRVAVFSADRAGLLAAGTLEVALEAVRRSDHTAPRWYPKLPRLVLREKALAEFDKSNVVLQLRAMEHRDVADGSNGDPGAEGAESGSNLPGEPSLEGWSLARCDARLTRRLGLL